MAKVSISDHFTYKKILRLTIAPILMMVFISLYSVVDGVCISNLSTHEAFAGVNLAYPITTIVGGFGVLFGAGGSALIGKQLGEKKFQDAKETFTNVVIAAGVIGLILSVIGYFAVEPYAIAMGKVGGEYTKAMVEEAIKYGRILMLGQVLFIIQNMFHTLFVVDEKPHLGFIFSVAAGVTNIVFDVIFIGPLQMGSTGAAIATVMGYGVGCFGPIIYFIFNKSGNIYFVKSKFKIKPVLKSASNGISEFVNFSAMAVSGILFNYQILNYYPGEMGQVGIEAYGVIMYVLLVFVAIFLGYSNTMSPVVSYNLGANNKKELNNVLKKSLIIIGIISVSMMALGEALSIPIAVIFSNGSQQVVELTTTAMRFWSISFLFAGYAIYGGTFFVGLNNGLVALAITTTRSLVFVILFTFTLPLAMGANGIWLSPMCTEAGAAILSLILIYTFRKKYGYQLFSKNNQDI